MKPVQNVVAAFSEDQTERLTGVSKSQLKYWDRTDFYKPSFSEDNRRMSFSRVYSFKDLVSLRILNVLRNQYNVSLPHLRDASSRLEQMESDPDRWTRYDLYVLNKKVIWHEPGTKLPQVIATKQYVVPTMSLQSIVSDTKRDTALSRNVRDKSKVGRIVRSRYVNHNLPVIAGTRIPVNAIKRFAQAGYTVDQIISEYPDLTPKDINAALKFGGKSKAA